MSNGMLGTTLLPKPWGRTDLPAPMGEQAEKIGELWFDVPDALDGILAKYLFTAERLSVQVHPLPEHSPTGVGKDECWLVTEARPDAVLALGFRQDFGAPDILRAALDGSIAHMLEWRAARVNDFYYVPSGTVHAIGPGLTLVEIQQATDITHRLFDYGRDRKLHLDAAMKSVSAQPYFDGLHRHVDPAEQSILVDGPHFRVYHCNGAPDPYLKARLTGAVQILPLDGACDIGRDLIGPGQSGWAPALSGIDFTRCRRCLLVTSA